MQYPLPEKAPVERPRDPAIFPVPRSILQSVIDSYQGFDEDELLAIEEANLSAPARDPALWVLSEGRELIDPREDYRRAYRTGVDFGATIVRRTIVFNHGDLDSDAYKLDATKSSPLPTSYRFVLKQYFEHGHDDVKDMLRATVEHEWVEHHVRFIETTSGVPPSDDPFVIGIGDAMQAYAQAHGEPIGQNPETDIISTP